MGTIYSRTDRRGRPIFYINYTFKHPVTGQLIRKREKVGQDQGAALDALRSRETDIRRQKFDGIIPEKTITLSQFKAQYLRHSKATKTSQTFERESGIIKNLLLPSFTVPLNGITAEDVENYRAERKAKGTAPASINKEIQLLKFIVKQAVKWGKIQTNQIAAVRPLPVPPGRVRFLEDNTELARVLDHCPNWLRPIALLAAMTGMRRGEILSLHRENIQRRARLIQLPKSKNNEARMVPMNGTVLTLLDSLPPRLDTTLLFADETGQAIDPNRVTTEFKRAAKRANVTDFHFHDLRHHFASHLTMKGQNQRTIMELLGHKTPAMTVRYQHLQPEHLLNAVAEIDAPELVQKR